jgi:CheY-like chemotaxis protein
MTMFLVVDDSAVDRRLVGGLLEKTMVCTVQFAASGLEALAQIQDMVPDLVVTDLMMPGMNGLELVKSLRARYPDVPVVLMTAHGSETLAMEALGQGAASYVPKSQLALKLPRTVHDVLEQAHADRGSKHLLSCLRQSEFHFALTNDARLIDPLVNLVQQMVAATGLADFTGRLRIGIALKEALLNALFHGNLELTAVELEQVQDTLIQESDLSLAEQRQSQPPYLGRRIHVDVRISPQEAHFVVRDEGPGFDVSSLPAPEDPGTMEGESGRGIVLMRSFMDEVTYNAQGNEVTLAIKSHGP